MEQMKKSSHCNHPHVKGAHLKTGNFVYSSGIKINFWVYENENDFMYVCIY